MALIVLPLPPVALKTNRVFGQHWAIPHKAKADYQAECIRVIRAMKWSEDNGHYPVHMRATVFIGKGMKLPDASDIGGWSKAAIDSLIWCLIFPNDSPKYINPFTAVALRDNKNPRLEISWEQP